MADPRHGGPPVHRPERAPVARDHGEGCPGRECRAQQSRDDEPPPRPEVRAHVVGVEVAKAALEMVVGRARLRGTRSLASRAGHRHQTQDAGEAEPLDGTHAREYTRALEVGEGRPRPGSVSVRQGLRLRRPVRQPYRVVRWQSGSRRDDADPLPGLVRGHPVPGGQWVRLGRLGRPGQVARRGHAERRDAGVCKGRPGGQARENRAPSWQSSTRKWLRFKGRWRYS